ncbi:hypothetical protein K435DRAFT_803888 [Dendrothele bispora CBS 962.96]|uniref:Uncharacterized protein n=1 Tax=Dendrothele bispora (strain CBS 962.96) TaxID=1314807 RepID=A0A4S8LG10_DENBC|nr:hypothetical protein K435DRAFT_803888 [Dendrothele bispora CBS 962.96]
MSRYFRSNQAFQRNRGIVTVTVASVHVNTVTCTGSAGAVKLVGAETTAACCSGTCLLVSIAELPGSEADDSLDQNLSNSRSSNGSTNCSFQDPQVTVGLSIFVLFWDWDDQVGDWSNCTWGFCSCLLAGREHVGVLGAEKGCEVVTEVPP